MLPELEPIEPVEETAPVSVIKPDVEVTVPVEKFVVVSTMVIPPLVDETVP